MQKERGNVTVLQEHHCGALNSYIEVWRIEAPAPKVLELWCQIEVKFSIVI